FRSRIGRGDDEDGVNIGIVKKRLVARRGRKSIFGTELRQLCRIATPDAAYFYRAAQCVEGQRVRLGPHAGSNHADPEWSLFMCHSASPSYDMIAPSSRRAIALWALWGK